MIKIPFGKEEEIHFGKMAPEGFEPINISDAQKAVIAIKEGMKLWRCTVCNDLHLGIEPTKICPTCNTFNAYVEINEKEMLTLLEKYQ